MTRLPALVIFDNDGVLVDSEPLIKRAQIAAFARDGIAMTEAWSNQYLIGLRPADVLDVVEKHFGKRPSDDILARYKVEFFRLIEEELKPTDGIVEALKALRQKGIAMAIGTSGTLEETFVKLKKTGLDAYFPPEAVFSGTEVPRGKPAPDLFLHAAARMGFAPADCVVIEDSHLGVQGAVAAGMKAIGFIGGGHFHAESGLSDERLLQAGAGVIVRHMGDLIEALAE